MSGLRVLGLRELTRDLQALGLELEDVKAAMARIAALATTVTRKHVPKRTGRLAGDARGNRARGKAVVTVGRASVPYAAPINYGWPARNIAPAHYVAATDAEMQPQAVRLLEAEINAQIRRKGLT